jgi:hypothetical protein
VQNGGTTDTYRWTQTLSDLNVFIPVPEGTRAKDVTVTISKTKLLVGLKGKPPLIDGALHALVKSDDCFWTVEDNKLMNVTLHKVNAMEWWNRVIVGDAEIDVRRQPARAQMRARRPAARALAWRLGAVRHAAPPPAPSRRKKSSRRTPTSPTWMARRGRRWRR